LFCVVFWCCSVDLTVRRCLARRRCRCSACVLRHAHCLVWHDEQDREESDQQRHNRGRQWQCRTSRLARYRAGAAVSTARGGVPEALCGPGQLDRATQVGVVGGAAAVASFSAAILTEIYICYVCSCQGILRRNGRGQALEAEDAQRCATRCLRWLACGAKRKRR
jgi:hypothetical protein